MLTRHLTATATLALLPILVAGAPASTAHRAASIAWAPDHEAALEDAKESQRIVFLAVNMDGERANDELAKKTYRAKTLVGLSKHSVNLVASAFEHSSGACSRFDGIRCSAHMACDIWARAEILTKDAEGYVIAPQHVWLAPTGEVLLSVPYAVTEAELEWCWVTALQANDPELALSLSSKARAPRRLVKGGLADAAGGAAGEGKTLSREEALELIEKIKRGLNQDRRAAAVRQIMAVDEPEAIEFVRTELRSGAGGRGGGRGGRGGGGRNAKDRRPAYLHSMGTVSPPSYWEIAAEYIDDSLLEVRAEAVVALEMLAAPESLKALRSALKKEKDPGVYKNILRALGTAGATDKKTVSRLIKAWDKEKEEIARRNAVLALGSLTKSDKVDQLLREILADEDRTERERAAAVCAMALTRRTEWLEILRPALRAAQAAAGEPIEGEPEDFVPAPELLSALQAAVQLLDGGDLRILRDPVTAAGRDTIQRDRWFGAKGGERR